MISGKLDGDLRGVELSLDGEVRRLSTTDVDELLGGIIALRAKMLPPVAAEFKPEQRYEGVSDPKWYVEHDLLGAPILHLRHPAFGWLHFLLPHASAESLGQNLQRLAHTPPPGAPRGRAS